MIVGLLSPKRARKATASLWSKECTAGRRLNLLESCNARKCNESKCNAAVTELVMQQYIVQAHVMEANIKASKCDASKATNIHQSRPLCIAI